MPAERQGSIANTDLVSDGANEPWSIQNLLKDGVKCKAICTKVVFKKLNLDAKLVASLEPARVGTKDWGAVSGAKGGQCCRGEVSFHSS